MQQKWAGGRCGRARESKSQHSSRGQGAGSSGEHAGADRQAVALQFPAKQAAPWRLPCAHHQAADLPGTHTKEHDVA